MGNERSCSVGRVTCGSSAVKGIVSCCWCSDLVGGEELRPARMVHYRHLHSIANLTHRFVNMSWIRRNIGVGGDGTINRTTRGVA